MTEVESMCIVCGRRERFDECPEPRCPLNIPDMLVYLAGDDAGEDR